MVGTDLRAEADVTFTEVSHDIGVICDIFLTRYGHSYVQRIDPKSHHLISGSPYPLTYLLFASNIKTCGEYDGKVFRFINLPVYYICGEYDGKIILLWRGSCQASKGSRQNIRYWIQIILISLNMWIHPRRRSKNT